MATPVASVDREPTAIGCVCRESAKTSEKESATMEELVAAEFKKSLDALIESSVWTAREKAVVLTGIRISLLTTKVGWGHLYGPILEDASLRVARLNGWFLSPTEPST